jgi:hypothetical protein
MRFEVTEMKKDKIRELDLHLPDWFIQSDKHGHIWMVR